MPYDEHSLFHPWSKLKAKNKSCLIENTEFAQQSKRIWPTDLWPTWFTHQCVWLGSVIRFFHLCKFFFLPLLLLLLPLFFPSPSFSFLLLLLLLLVKQKLIIDHLLKKKETFYFFKFPKGLLQLRLHLRYWAELCCQIGWESRTLTESRSCQPLKAPVTSLGFIPKVVGSHQWCLSRKGTSAKSSLGPH